MDSLGKSILWQAFARLPILSSVAVLGGEPAVPCTRNPLQRG